MSKETNTALELMAKSAKEIFKAHEMDEVFITSDGQGYTDEHKAHDHARILSDKTVKKFEREFAETKEKAAKEGDNIDDEGAGTERNQLISDYMELFGAKPNHNISTEKLAQKIAEKKAEIEKDQEGQGTV